MKAKELKEILDQVPEDTEVHFEVSGHNQGGESEVFPQWYESHYLYPEKELIIRFEEES